MGQLLIIYKITQFHSFSVKDYYVTGGLCGVTFAIIVALLVVFCRTYKFPQRKETISKR